MTKKWVASIGLVLGLIISLLSAAPQTEARPVIVELFTSEGCSSCPPADKLLIELLLQQPVENTLIIGLGHHVDYWDQLGWKDPFSARLFSTRQRELGKALGLEQIYTPQLVVNGKIEFVGSRRGEALQAIAKAADSTPLEVSLSSSEGTDPGAETEVAIEVAGLRKGSRNRYRVRLAITEDNLISTVSRGENRGRTLQHAAVTRWFRTITSFRTTDEIFKTTTRVQLNSDWKRDQLTLVAFVENLRTLEIVGAAARELTPSAGLEKR